MNDISSDAVDETVAKQEPQVFPSHRHADKEIANIVRQYIRNYTGGSVDVFQSSYSGSSPEIGKILTDNLGRELDDSQVVLLIFTVADEDWSYCMWETGVAFNPRREDTRIVVLQCGQSIPAPLSDKARVQVKDKESVKAFMRQFLTDPNFFPVHGKPISAFSPDGDEVREAGEKLHEALEQSIVSVKSDKSWSAWPHICFRLPMEHAEGAKAALVAGQAEEAYELLSKSCVIHSHDDWSACLFGVQDFPDDQPIADFAETRKTDNPGAGDLWAVSLLKQIGAAVRSKYPDSSWGLLRHAENDKCYAPMSYRVCESPSKGVIDFDVCFPRLDVDDAGVGLKYEIPEHLE